jgi:hypothetical protein
MKWEWSGKVELLADGRLTEVLQLEDRSVGHRFVFSSDEFDCIARAHGFIPAYTERAASLEELKQKILLNFQTVRVVTTRTLLESREIGPLPDTINIRETTIGRSNDEIAELNIRCHQYVRLSALPLELQTEIRERLI